VPFLRYDATKASIDEVTTTERQRRVRFLALSAIEHEAWTRQNSVTVSMRAGSIINAFLLCKSNCWTS